jgi:hypothetical protein
MHAIAVLMLYRRSPVLVAFVAQTVSVLMLFCSVASASAPAPRLESVLRGHDATYATCSPSTFPSNNSLYSLPADRYARLNTYRLEEFL